MISSSLNKILSQVKKNFFIVVIIVFVYILLTISFIIPSEESGVLKLDSGWTVTVNDTIYSNAKLSKLTFPAVGQNDRVILSNKIPKVDMISPVLQFTAYHSVIHVYIDGVLEYSFGEENARMNRMVGMGYFYVPIQEESTGKDIKIVLDVTEWNSFTRIEPIVLGQYDQLVFQFFKKNRISLVVSSFSVVIGFISLVAAAVMIRLKSESYRIMWIGFYFFDMGIWMACSSKLIMFWSQDVRTNTLLEFVSFYFAIIPVLMLIYLITKGRNIISWILKGLIVINSSFWIMSLVLHMFNIIHLPAILFAYHILLFFTLMMLMINGIISIKKNISIEKYLIIGVLIMIAVAFMELLKYNLQRYALMDNVPSLMPVGLMTFGICLFIENGKNVEKRVYEKAEKDLLTKRAYYDSLTEIYNRTRCQEIFDEMQDENGNYAIVSFDLNYLKKINDTVGHEYGDKLIKGFALILVKVFGDKGTVGRMGGDEFVVILPEISEEKLKLDLENISNIMKQESMKEKHIFYSAAWGYAFHKSGDPETLRSVYRRADKEMYAMKYAMKAERTE